MVYEIHGKELSQYKQFIKPEEATDFDELCNQPDSFKEKVKGYSFHFDMTEKDKDFRTQLHVDIKRYMKGFKSFTKEIDDKKYIISQFEGKEARGRFLSFKLRKRNWDTMSALNNVARRAKKATGNFFFAGTKDKRGETVQWVTAKNVLKKELAGFIKISNWKWDEISFSDLQYTNEPIKLGDLQGNRFTIALRLLNKLGDSEIKANVDRVAQKGFINYFGQQRFGTKNVYKTHDTGKHIILKEYKEAFFTILKASDKNENVNEAVKIIEEEENFGKALKLLNYKCNIERTLIQPLTKNKNDFLSGIMNLTKNLRNLYGHAYQSFLWNKAVSVRLKKYGTQIRKINSQR